ncbi:MAG TPA: GNAT family N-acetyltransferase [Polyangiaceae bacterium]|nr:GNAT family N-acetyltransferase [Polyangiaceae bacterium]
MTARRAVPSVQLLPATLAEAELLSNLLELYIHDLSPYYPHVELGADGRFGYPDLPRYWSEPTRRFPFLIRASGRVAGFVLARRGSPASSDPEVLDVVEFFVLRQQRRGGVGREAALQLWRRLPGSWTVRVSEGNPGALDFWRRAVGQAANGNVMESSLPGRAHPWRVLSFSVDTQP